MKNKSFYGCFIIFISLVVFSIINCGYDAGGIYRASGDYTGAALANAYYREYITGIIVLSIIFAIIGGIVAYNKRRSVIGWGLLCGLFWVIPLIVVVSMSKLNDNSNTKNIPLNLVDKNWKDIFLENNLEEYIGVFEKNKLTDLNIIMELNESDLEKLGIDIMGDRKKILKIFSIDALEANKVSDTNNKSNYKIIKLSIYKDPSLNSNIILTLTQGEKVSIIEKGEKMQFVDDYWVKIMCEDGSTGWCFLNNLEEWNHSNNLKI